jgi:hypothetical protein
MLASFHVQHALIQTSPPKYKKEKLLRWQYARKFAVGQLPVLKLYLRVSNQVLS